MCTNITIMIKSPTYSVLNYSFSPVNEISGTSLIRTPMIRSYKGCFNCMSLVNPTSLKGKVFLHGQTRKFVPG